MYVLDMYETMFGVHERRRTIDAFYYVPFVNFFHKKLRLNDFTPSYTHFTKTKEHIEKLVPVSSLLYIVMVYLDTHKTDIALKFLSSHSQELERVQNEKNVWDALDYEHRVRELDK